MSWWQAAFGAVDRNVAARVAARLQESLRRRFAVEQQQRDQQTLSLLEWGRYYLPDHFRLPPSGMHVWLAEQLDANRHERLLLNGVGPRGGAKSTLVTLAYVLRAVVEARTRYVWIVSDTRRQACAHLENIKAELTDNARLASDYPLAAGVGPKWTAGAVELRNSVAIEAYGTGQRIRGRRRRADRPTLIVADDVQNDSHMQSALQRERSRNWFHGTLLKAGTKQTTIVNLATALHRDALAMELARTAGWTSRVFQAVEQWPDNMQLWETWEATYTDRDQPNATGQARAFFEQHRAAMEQGARLLWPEEEDLYTLMRMRVESGRATFEREKQNSPIDPALCEFPEDYFNQRIWFDDWPRGLRLRGMALDPSKGHDARRGDYSAYVMLGIDARGTIFIEADLARRPTPQMVADGVALYQRFRPDAFGVEANQYQELLAGEFEAEFARQGVVAAPPWLLDNRVNKLVRIRRLGPFLASGRLRFKNRSAGTRLLVDQLRDFPAGDHDDGPDAAEMALRLAQELLAARANDGLGDRLPLER